MAFTYAALQEMTRDFTDHPPSTLVERDGKVIEHPTRFKMAPKHSECRVCKVQTRCLSRKWQGVQRGGWTHEALCMLCYRATNNEGPARAGFLAARALSGWWKR